MNVLHDQDARRNPPDRVENYVRRLVGLSARKGLEGWTIHGVGHVDEWAKGPGCEEWLTVPPQDGRSLGLLVDELVDQAGFADPCLSGNDNREALPGGSRAGPHLGQAGQGLNPLQQLIGSVRHFDRQCI
jgi:hypothetical protein